MYKTFKLFILFVIAITMFTECKQDAKKETILYEEVNDSVYAGQNNYKENFAQWKKIYEGCMQTPLFQNAFYVGLQENIHIGSISNQYAANVNKQFSILDTSNYRQIFNLLAINKETNCYTNIDLNEDLQNDFYKELLKSLANSGQYQYLKKFIDTNQIRFKITTFADNTIVPDSLVSLLQRTKDSSLLHFKKLLLTNGNALLTRTAMITGFYAEFQLKRKLSASEEAKFRNEVFYKTGDDANGSIKLLSGNIMRVIINKYYTVFGQFFVFKESE